jgi:ABC-type branched-subunit amino acid transport system substrate-binding protein
MEGYLSAKVLAEGLKRAGKNPSRDSVINALESIQKADFGGYLVDFGQRDHTASRFVDLSMLTEDGKVRR